jgi:hypothetical protein
MPTFKKYFNQLPMDLSNSEELSSSTFILPFGNQFPGDFQGAVLERINSLLDHILS